MDGATTAAIFRAGAAAGLMMRVGANTGSAGWGMVPGTDVSVAGGTAGSWASLARSLG
ncbi:MAG TPA: hypothetical protein VIJ20_02175 [Solirubrobacteraceae bacterium]